MRRRALGIALLIVVAAYAAPPQETYTLRGPEQVTDGWIASAGNGQAFAAPTLRVDGQAWETYYRTLVRFDLRQLEPSRFAQVKRATLRLTAVVADNPAAVPTRVAACDTAWSPAATFAAPQPDQGWPKRQEYANPDYAMLPEDEVSQVITAAGAVAGARPVRRLRRQRRTTRPRMPPEKPPIRGDPSLRHRTGSARAPRVGCAPCTKPPPADWWSMASTDPATSSWLR